MKRLHVHVGVNDLDQSIRFYSTLFAAEPAVVKDDYAKWMLEDPRVNFAISSGREAAKGVEHLGIQVEDEAELAEVYDRLKAADRRVDGVRRQPGLRRARRGSSPRGGSGEVLRAGLRPRLSHPKPRREARREGRPMNERVYNVLFLCTGKIVRAPAPAEQAP